MNHIKYESLPIRIYGFSYKCDKSISRLDRSNVDKKNFVTLNYYAIGMFKVTAPYPTNGCLLFTLYVVVGLSARVCATPSNLFILDESN